MNKAIFALTILFGSLFCPLYGMNVTFINSDNETKTIDTDQDGIMCIPGLDLNDELVYEFVPRQSAREASEKASSEQTPNCFINRRDWLHAIGQASEVRTRWLNRALDFSGKEITSINVYQRIEEGTYVLTETINTQIGDNRIACAPEQHRLPEEALNPAQVAEALGEHVVIPHHVADVAPALHHDEPVPVAEHVAPVPPHVEPIAEHVAGAPVAENANPLIIIQTIDGRRLIELSPLGIETLAAIRTTHELYPLWIEVLYQLQQGRLNLSLRNHNITTAQLAAILRLLPQPIKDDIYELDLNNNALETLPPEIAQLPRLRILNVDNNRIAQLPAEIIQRINRGELRISTANNPIANQV